jgi:transcription elongation GreA/GreB family factor
VAIEMQESTAKRVAPRQTKGRHERRPRLRRSSGDQAAVGSRVEFIDLEHDDTLEYELVRAIEADPARGKLSVASPLGRVLLGRRAGDMVEVESDARGRNLIVVRAVSPRENELSDAWLQRAAAGP